MDSFLTNRTTADPAALKTFSKPAQSGKEGEAGGLRAMKALIGVQSSEKPKAEPEANCETGDAGTRVETVVEHGRVTKIIVTCSCGKVTELTCQY